MPTKFHVSFFALFLVVACQESQKTTTTDPCADSSATSAMVPAADDTIFDPIAHKAAKPCGSINLWGGSFPKSLNMWQDYNSFSVGVLGLMFESLVGLHSVKNEPVGILAERWETSADGRTYTFHIDPRSKWSDGKPIVARDVQFYYDVIMDPANLTPIFKVGLSRFDRPVLLDSLSFSITAKEAHWGNFWEAAGMTAFPSHLWEGKSFNDIRFEFPVVSGPYKIKELKKDRSLELIRRADWWGFAKAWNQGKYNFATVRYRFIEDRNKVLEAFKKGDIDAYPVYTSSLWMMQTDFEAVQKGEVARQQIYNREPVGFQGFAINLRLAKFQDIRVRQALAMLLDRQLMNEKFMYNQYFMQDSYFPDLYPNLRHPQAPEIRFDAAKARQLLAEAGWKPDSKGMLAKDGKNFSIDFLTSMDDLRHLTRYQEDLRSVGIDARIEQMSWSTLRQRMDEFDFDMYWSNWGGSRLRDPESMWHSRTANEKGSNNLSGVVDPKVDSLIELQKTVMDIEGRNEILRTLDLHLTQTLPYVLMWNSAHHRLLWWRKFGTPTYVYDKFNREESIIAYWWYDTAQAKSGAKPPSEVRFQDP